MNQRESIGAFVWILTLQFFVAQGVVQYQWTTPFSLAHNMISDLRHPGTLVPAVRAPNGRVSRRSH